jgi:hypothetical protein
MRRYLGATLGKTYHFTGCTLQDVVPRFNSANLKCYLEALHFVSRNASHATNVVDLKHICRYTVR